MLYISRKIGAKKFGVIDDDDGVEEILTLDALKEATCDLGIEILGVTLREKCYKSSTRSMVIERVDVFMPPDDVTMKQKKFQVLFGVDVKVNNGCIVSVEWNDLQAKNRVVRLSDFGNACGAGIFSFMADKYSHNEVSASNLTVILDDKLTVERKTFSGVADLDVVFDVRSVTKPEIINSFYNAAIDPAKRIDYLKHHVLDDRQRLDEWIATRIVNFGANYMYGGNRSLDAYVKDVDHVNKFILAKYKDEFLRFLSRYKFELREDDSIQSVEDSIKKHLSQMATSKSGLMYSQNFDELWSDFMESKGSNNLRQILLYKTKSGYSAQVRRLVHYLMYFDAPEDIKDVFVGFYHKATQILIAKAKQRGYIK